MAALLGGDSQPRGVASPSTRSDPDAEVPESDPDYAVREIERVGGEDSVVTVYSWVEPKVPWGAEQFDPVFQALGRQRPPAPRLAGVLAPARLHPRRDADLDRDPGVRLADPRHRHRPRAGADRRVGYSPSGHASLPARVRMMFVESQNSTSSPSSFSARSSMST